MTELQRLDRELVDILAEYEGQLSYESRPYVPSSENLERMLSRIASVSTDISAAKKVFTGEAEAVLFGHWDELLELAEARLNDEKGYPYRYVRPIIGRINSLVNFDNNDMEARVAGLSGILSATPQVLNAVRDLLANVPVTRRESSIDMITSVVNLAQALPARIARAFATVGESRLNRLLELSQAMGHTASDVLVAAKTLPGPPASSAEMGLAYKDTLQLIYGIDVNELVDMHR